MPSSIGSRFRRARSMFASPPQRRCPYRLRTGNAHPLGSRNHLRGAILVGRIHESTLLRAVYEPSFSGSKPCFCTGLLHHIPRGGRLQVGSCPPACAGHICNTDPHLPVGVWCLWPPPLQKRYEVGFAGVPNRSRCGLGYSTLGSFFSGNGPALNLAGFGFSTGYFGRMNRL
jgi:hypothetical protein